ncbi:hypothetical protein CCMSSC00406_0008603 [Pleurotus cornucopiae]|uniref:Uncharacterized protein n=1 Tax=Pleurotus cornucopiae TaxID=5321 RepID=A0ACB7IKK6_PLECO|nr:hypothetical protein CCMSSC00406_0008603 [Pleurotus cornucopiae]
MPPYFFSVSSSSRPRADQYVRRIPTTEVPKTSSTSSIATGSRSFETMNTLGITFAFNPTSITGAVAGDTITFIFMSRNRTYDHDHDHDHDRYPMPIPPDGGVAGGLDTNFHSATGTNQSQAVVTLASANTQWVACRQAASSHYRMGMIFSVDPTVSQTHLQFLANASAP